LKGARKAAIPVRVAAAAGARAAVCCTQRRVVGPRGRMADAAAGAAAPAGGAAAASGDAAAPERRSKRVREGAQRGMRRDVGAGEQPSCSGSESSGDEAEVDGDSEEEGALSPRKAPRLPADGEYTAQDLQVLQDGRAARGTNTKKGSKNNWKAYEVRPQPGAADANSSAIVVRIIVPSRLRASLFTAPLIRTRRRPTTLRNSGRSRTC
jgi:hypothetical protein